MSVALTLNIVEILSEIEPLSKSAAQISEEMDNADSSGSLTSSTVGYKALTTLVKSMVFVGTLEVGEHTVGSSPGAQKAVRNNAAFS